MARKDHYCAGCCGECDCPGLHMLTDCTRCTSCHLREYPHMADFDPWFEPPPLYTTAELIVFAVVLVLCVLLIWWT